MKKFTNFIQSSYGKVATGLTIASVSLPVFASESTSSIATSISNSMQQIVTDTIATIGAVAPIGITIFGAMFAWKKGIQFFRGVTK